MSTAEKEHFLVYVVFMGGWIGLVAERVIHLAFIKASDVRAKETFVSKDWVLVITALLTSLAVLLPSAIKYGPGDMIRFVGEANHSLNGFGFVVAAVMVIYVLQPFVVAICLAIGCKKRRRRASSIMPIPMGMD